MSENVSTKGPLKVTGKVMYTKPNGEVVELGKALDVEYTLDDEPATVTAIPLGKDEVIVPITNSNAYAVAEILEHFMTDAQRYLAWRKRTHRNIPDFDNARELREVHKIVSYAFQWDRQGYYTLGWAIFEDGSAVATKGRDKREFDPDDELEKD